MQSVLLSSTRSSFALEFLERRILMHCHVVSLVALDQILRLLLRGADGIGLKFDGGGDLLLDRPPDVARFRVPLHMIPNFEFVFDRYYFYGCFLF
jgi:hypothetical protein